MEALAGLGPVSSVVTALNAWRFNIFRFGDTFTDEDVFVVEVGAVSGEVVETFYGPVEG